MRHRHKTHGYEISANPLITKMFKAKGKPENFRILNLKVSRIQKHKIIPNTLPSQMIVDFKVM